MCYTGEVLCQVRFLNVMSRALIYVPLLGSCYCSPFFPPRTKCKYSPDNKLPRRITFRISTLAVYLRFEKLRSAWNAPTSPPPRKNDREEARLSLVEGRSDGLFIANHLSETSGAWRHRWLCAPARCGSPGSVVIQGPEPAVSSLVDASPSSPKKPHLFSA